MTETYILRTNEKARERLNLQHQLYAQSSINLLHEAGIGTGMKGLEIGCGSGAMTIELTKLVGENGQLFAIDLIDHVKKLTKNYSNITFKVWDVTNLVNLGEQFDFIYCRMVLHHLENAHPVILQMTQCLRPGGVIICEEPTLFDTTFFSPPSPAYEQFTQLARACFANSKRDFDIAYRLEQEFLSCGMRLIHHTLFQPLLRTPEQKAIYYMGLADLTPELKNLNIASDKEITLLSKQLKQLAHSNCTMSWIRMHKLIAKAAP